MQHHHPHAKQLHHSDEHQSEQATKHEALLVMLLVSVSVLGLTTCHV